MKARQITPGVFWVGAQDWDRRLFDSLIPLPDGTSYNSYLIKGTEKTVLLDAVDPTKLHLLQEYLKDVEKLDFLVSHHAEQDHSGAIPWVLKQYQDCVLLCSDKARNMLVDHLLVPAARIKSVADGEELSLGGKTLRFIYTPWVHWPETMSTYLEEDKILFSCDWFGSHLATTDIFVERIDFVLEGAKRYYAEIMMPFRRIVRQNLEKIKDLEIKTIAPSHGPIYRKPELIIEAYRDWTDDLPHNQAVIVWVTMHGSTERMVEHLINELSGREVIVLPFNLTVADIGKLALSLVDAGTLIAAGPTVHVGPHPVLLNALNLANALRPKTRFVGLIGSYGWGSKMAEAVKSALSNLKVEFLEPVICRGYPRESDLAAISGLAEQIAELHKKSGFRNLR